MGLQRGRGLKGALEETSPGVGNTLLNGDRTTSPQSPWPTSRQPSAAAARAPPPERERERDGGWGVGGVRRDSKSCSPTKKAHTRTLPPSLSLSLFFFFFSGKKRAAAMLCQHAPLPLFNDDFFLPGTLPGLLLPVSGGTELGPGFAPTPIFLWCQILCSLQSLQTINRGPARLQYTHTERTLAHVKDHKVHVRVWWITETLNITQHACTKMCHQRPQN